jgi:hypothetical protein
MSLMVSNNEIGPSDTHGLADWLIANRTDVPKTVACPFSA